MTDPEIDTLRRAAETPAAAGRSDLDAVADDLAAAFAEDPVFNWIMRPDRRRAAAQKRFMRIIAAMGLRDGEVTRPAVGGAASIWMPSEKLGPSPVWEELRLLPEMLAATGFSRFGRLAALRKAMDSRHPMSRPHAYLWLIGVRPEAQGFGVGSRLLSANLAAVDARGLPAYLESSSPANVPLYRRHGFEVMEEFRPAPDAPPLWAMWREPA